MDLEEFRDTREKSDCECELDEFSQVTITKEALADYISAYTKYLECKEYLERKQASLKIHTDWSNALPNHNRPTVGDKEAYIADVVYELKGKVNEAYLRKKEYEELYKIELLILEEECRQ